jgi:NADH-quinone oxidoreductase subunit L
MEFLEHNPGLLYVAATLLPLVSFAILLLLGAIRNAARPYSKSGIGQTIFWVAGGDIPTKVGAYVATAAIGLSCVLCVIGLVWFLNENPISHGHEHGPGHTHAVGEGEKEADHERAHGQDDRWAGHMEFLHIGQDKTDFRTGLELTVGYRIDHLSAVMFVMVSFIATLIHLFSAGYMADELNVRVTDHQVHGEDGEHLRRRGRFSRFFMYLSLFCFSMLNLVLADNLFQVFVSWELVGICSFLLIGFQYERQSASNAANKAFITNRIGDAGFIIGMLIIWSFVGTFNFQEIFQRVRGPESVAHNDHYMLAGQIVRVQPKGDKHSTRVRGQDVQVQDYVWTPPGETAGSHVALFPLTGHWHAIGTQPQQDTEIRVPENGQTNRYGTIPYVLLTIAGIGIFIGCMGKSAQFPLHVWLPDAMEGPTPVSALIHAATMVAAGVYLVGRVFPLFTPEARMVIAYTGGITLFVAATIAIVMNDIKKVLAYSTVSQLGYMMLALGIGGWIAGLLHLLTHAFFKALLFLGSGSVIHGCHHEQDMRRMGGLFKKMPITAITMLIGVLAIAGTPFFSGWYSKDAIIAQGVAFGAVYQQHLLLLILPLVTAGITCFYMFRMWFLTFTGKPKDEHIHEHAHESPKLMTVPLILLAILSLGVAWGWPFYDAEASYLGKILHSAEPAAVSTDFKPVQALLDNHESWLHPTAALIAFIAAALGVLFALLVYFYKVMDPGETKEQFGFLYRLFDRKWYFDELYSALLVRPALVISHWCRNADVKGIDRLIDGIARLTVRTSRADGRFDKGIVDGFVNVLADATSRAGACMRRVQTGSLRNYILFLVLAAVGIFAALSYFMSLANAGP